MRSSRSTASRRRIRSGSARRRRRLRCGDSTRRARRASSSSRGRTWRRAVARPEPAVATKAPDPARASAADGVDEVRWRVWPARQRPLTAIVLIAGAMILGVLVSRGTQDQVLGIAAPVFVLGSLSSFLLPTEYRLTRDGVTVKSLAMERTRPWSEMRRFEEDRSGVFLSPFEKRSWLDAYRGVRLDPGGNRDQVVAFVQARLAPARRG